ncbi:MAG TPA: Em GEA1 (EM1) [Candidatus Bathyarchaeia archaeon]
MEEKKGKMTAEEAGRKGGQSGGNKISAIGKRGLLEKDTKSRVHQSVEKAKLNL